jgi:uncharacterized protein YndB with AHSA1/START domain
VPESDRVTRSVEVSVDPATAFELFTARMDEWWRPGPFSWHDPSRAVGKRLEPWVGGRWIEVWDRATGEGYEEGRVLVWEPGRRLVFTFRALAEPDEPATEVEVRFEPQAGGTRVVLEHRGLDRLSPERAARRRSGKGFGIMLGWFAEHLAERASRRVPAQ